MDKMQTQLMETILLMLVDQMLKSLGVIRGNFKETMAIGKYFLNHRIFYTSSLSTPTKTGPGSVQASRDPLQEQGKARSVYR